MARARGRRTGSGCRSASRRSRHGTAPRLRSCLSARRLAAAGREGTRGGFSPHARRGGTRRGAVRSRACPTAPTASAMPRRSGRRARRPPHAFAPPERHCTGDAGRRRDEHPVARDLLDPPRGGAEHERLPLTRLVDHLLVELADAAAVPHLEDAVQTAVGDRPGVRDREPARAGATADHPGGPVPDDPGRSSANSSDG